MFADFFGEADLREIRRHQIELFLEQGIPGPWAPKTKKEVLGLLHKLFHDASDLEMVDRIPGWPKVQVQEPEVKWLTAEWQEKVIAEIAERDRPIFQFMCAWGVRPGEARALQWEDVDFEKETITIRRTFSGAGCNHLQAYTKTRRVRTLPITTTLAPIFKRLRGIGGFVFRNSHGRPYTADLSRLWREAADKCGAPRVNLYQGTRHSFATQHLDQLFLVSKALGHTTTQMTKRYEGQNVEKLKQLGPPANRRQMDEKRNKIN
jgi:integrase